MFSLGLLSRMDNADSIEMEEEIEKLFENASKLNGKPTEVTPYLYIGNYNNAYDTALLKKLGITHVLNCAQLLPANPYKGHEELTGVRFYCQFEARDDNSYNPLQHSNLVAKFIEHARAGKGKVLLHCIRGVNRSVCLALAYLMEHQGWNLLEGVKFLAEKRGKCLENNNFRQCLIELNSKIRTASL
ncbi:unnamed protein product [Dimorphilus gyrociliatus]|uniref:Dual specificity protein phosphatase n=1 Tax=Dimorphilus gyrociliatus TaxID=2664684 RepID=A0A7I8VM64_9ANNE|nr:unnamed protein product [Dimorphilus gyrociliatus]